MESFDFIIVGSGSAGSAMANRLSEDGTHSVLVLEYGGTDMGAADPDALRPFLPDEHDDL